MGIKVILGDSLNLPLKIGIGFGSTKQIVFQKKHFFGKSRVFFQYSDIHWGQILYYKSGGATL